VRDPQASEQESLKFIKKYIEDNGWAPSIREIAEGIGRSVNASYLAVQRLEKQGLIETGPHARQIRLVRMKATKETL
jgi:SOS-response transcriptional repressor LexA